uniref:Insulin-like growth factor II n=1 Tax=Salmo salar TaxID=8030 RepID=B9ELN4_SALSA|nr:Insulin-like growth factor II [Salmo salar]ACM08431.1 Insulin-like growth factor II precursor [Salmo salar]
METQKRHEHHSVCHTCRRTENTRMKVIYGNPTPLALLLVLCT